MRIHELAAMLLLWFAWLTLGAAAQDAKPVAPVIADAAVPAPPTLTDIQRLEVERRLLAIDNASLSLQLAQRNLADAQREGDAFIQALFKSYGLSTDTHQLTRGADGKLQFAKKEPAR